MDYYNNETILEQAREIESLRQQLVSVTKERDEIAAQARMLDRMVDERDEQLAAAEAAMQEVGNVKDQLAAALAACETKDIALSQLIQHTLACEQRLDEFNGLGDLSGSGCSVDICEATQALAIQPDASTLKAHDEAEGSYQVFEKASQNEE